MSTTNTPATRRDLGRARAAGRGSILRQPPPDGLAHGRPADGRLPRRRVRHRLLGLGHGLQRPRPACSRSASPPRRGIFAGPWFIAGVVGGLVVRRPGAALLCEVIAALVSMIPGTKWGATVLVSGIVQGLGAELAFALFGYRVFGLVAAVLAGALAGPFAAGVRVDDLDQGLGHWTGSSPTPASWPPRAR